MFVSGEGRLCTFESGFRLRGIDTEENLAGTNKIAFPNVHGDDSTHDLWRELRGFGGLNRADRCEHIGNGRVENLDDRDFAGVFRFPSYASLFRRTADAQEENCSGENDD